MGYRVRCRLWVVISAMAVAGAMTGAVAQTGDTKGVAAGGLEEIIVTSTRREERLQDVPISNNLSLRAGVRFNGFDVSIYGNNLTNSHPLMFESRDVPASSDPLYFGRGVRPLTIGVTGTYRY